MGNENHQHNYKSTFLPILCSRPSIKDVTLPRSCRNQPASTSCNDPLSPRIGCMGQVKRNNKIAGFPTSSHYRLLSFSDKSSATISPVVKYSKLKSLFSSKNLSSSTPSITSATTISSCRRTKPRVAGNSSAADVSKNQRCSGNRNIRRNENVVVAINIDAMDPPLPVMVKRVEEGRQVDSLWKRRLGGPTITNLQLQQIQHPNICPQPTTV